MHAHPPHLAHHFDTPEQQFDSGKLGMWLFLATEILLFGGLFCAYAVYRGNHPEIFVYAHQFLDKNLGALNTVVLLCSSFTMAWSVRAAQLGHRRALIVLLSLTLLGGFTFMGVKYVEYKHKWQHGLLWGKSYESQEGHGEASPGAAGAHASESAAAGDEDGSSVVAPAAPSAEGGGEAGAERSLIPPAAVGPRGTRDVAAGSHGAEGHASEVVPENVHLFFGIYFMMTGLHGLHVLAGMAAIAWLVFRAAAGHFGSAYFTPVDLVGLYWHLVDLIWIFLFPLLYLIH